MCFLMFPWSHACLQMSLSLAHSLYSTVTVIASLLRVFFPILFYALCEPPCTYVAPKDNPHGRLIPEALFHYRLFNRFVQGCVSFNNISTVDI